MPDGKEELSWMWTVPSRLVSQTLWEGGSWLSTSIHLSAGTVWPVTLCSHHPPPTTMAYAPSNWARINSFLASVAAENSNKYKCVDKSVLSPLNSLYIFIKSPSWKPRSQCWKGMRWEDSYLTATDFTARLPQSDPVWYWQSQNLRVEN